MKIKKDVFRFIKQLIKSPEKIEFFAYVKGNNIQSIGFDELSSHYERPDELKNYLNEMVKLGLLEQQVIDKIPYFSYLQGDPETSEIIDRFYTNYITAKNIFYKKAEQDFFEKSADIRKDKELLDQQVKDLEIFTRVSEEVRKIHRLDDLFSKVPYFCVELMEFQSAELYSIGSQSKKSLISARYSDGSHKNFNYKEFNENLQNDTEQQKLLTEAEKSNLPVVEVLTHTKYDEVKHSVILTTIVENQRPSFILQVGYGVAHRRIVDRDVNRIATFTNTIQIALSTVRLFDELERKVQQRTEELNKANETLAESNLKMEEINKEMKRELKVASGIQSAMIPKTFPEYPNVRFGALWKSMTEVSGDYYDVFPIPAKKKISFYVADVSGHGVPAALITTMAKVSLSSHAQTEETTAGVCEKANKEIYSTLGDIGFYLTAFVGIFDAKTNELQFTNAGHQMGLWLHSKTNEITQITSPGFFIGSFEEATYGYDSIVMENGDKVMFFTDGIVEARNDSGDFFEETRLHNFFRTNKDMPAEQFAQKLFDDVEKFCNGRPANDDRTILVIDCIGDPTG